MQSHHHVTCTSSKPPTAVSADDDALTRSIARRFGFTKPSRLIAAYRKQFGEDPNEVRRRRPKAVAFPGLRDGLVKGAP